MADSLPDLERVTCYAIFERTPVGVRLRALFDDSPEGCQAALDVGTERFEDFHAAAPAPGPGPGRGDCAYLTKCHGVLVERGDA